MALTVIFLLIPVLRLQILQNVKSEIVKKRGWLKIKEACPKLNQILIADSTAVYTLPLEGLDHTPFPLSLSPFPSL